MLVHRFDSPDRFVAGTVGQPGERTFFLQARQGNRITSVACEKQQVSILAEHLTTVLNEVVVRGIATAPVPEAPAQAADTDPLDAPITEEFRVGDMTLSWDSNQERIVIELFSTAAPGAEEDEFALGADDDDEDEGDEPDEQAGVGASEVFIVTITPGDAREFVVRAEALVSAGRPPCPFCLQPLEPEGHICPRANGYRRPLF